MGRMCGLTETEIKQLVDETGSFLKGTSVSLSPPELTGLVQNLLRQKPSLEDPYKAIKRESNLLALKELPYLHGIVKNSHDPLKTAVALAIAGNIIDFGAAHDLDIHKEIQQLTANSLSLAHLEETPLFRFTEFSSALEKASQIIYLGDNAGEAIFDRLLLEVIHAVYPDKKLTFVTRGLPVLNDVTLEDMDICSFPEYVEIISSGVDAPGTLLHRCSSEFLERFSQTDMIISKGQGNYEALNEVSGYPVWFMFIVKCPVIAKVVGGSLRDLVLFSPGKEI